MADSRPDPGPFTVTSTVFMPCSSAFLAALSAAIWAANGVDFFDPENPAEPQLDQTITLPDLSVMVTIVLLKVARICATPSEILRRTFFLDLNFFDLATCF